jgi:hypothetical protein
LNETAVRLKASLLKRPAEAADGINQPHPATPIGKIKPSKSSLGQPAGAAPAESIYKAF